MQAEQGFTEIVGLGTRKKSWDDRLLLQDDRYERS